MTFKAIDTQLVLDTAINAATKSGLTLDLKHYGKGHELFLASKAA